MIEERYLNKSRIRLTQPVEDVRPCWIRAVSRNAVQQLIEALEPCVVTRRRIGTKAARRTGCASYTAQRRLKRDARVVRSSLSNLRLMQPFVDVAMRFTSRRRCTEEVLTAGR